MSFEKERERELRRRSLEAREVGVEQKESKEAEVDPELKKAAAMERADYLTKEIKSSQKQMQNILLHIQQVTAAIKKIRQQLQLVEDGEDASVARDKTKVAELKKQIAEYREEIIKMREDLVREQIAELKNQGVVLSHEELQQKAEQMVDNLINDVLS